LNFVWLVYRPNAFSCASIRFCFTRLLYRPALIWIYSTGNGFCNPSTHSAEIHNLDYNRNIFPTIYLILFLRPDSESSWILWSSKVSAIRIPSFVWEVFLISRIVWEVLLIPIFLWELLIPIYFPFTSHGRSELWEFPGSSHNCRGLLIPIFLWEVLIPIFLWEVLIPIFLWEKKPYQKRLAVARVPLRAPGGAANQACKAVL